MPAPSSASVLWTGVCLKTWSKRLSFSRRRYSRPGCHCWQWDTESKCRYRKKSVRVQSAVSKTTGMLGRIEKETLRAGKKSCSPQSILEWWAHHHLDGLHESERIETPMPEPTSWQTISNTHSRTYRQSCWYPARRSDWHQPTPNLEFAARPIFWIRRVGDAFKERVSPPNGCAHHESLFSQNYCVVIQPCACAQLCYSLKSLAGVSERNRPVFILVPRVAMCPAKKGFLCRQYHQSLASWRVAEGPVLLPLL